MTYGISPTVGIDFGTTNTVVAIAGADGEAVILRFDAPVLSGKR